MKHEFSKATLDKAARLARRNGHAAAAALICGRPQNPAEELLDAAVRGDEKTIRKLLGEDITKYEFLKATLARAERLARKNGHVAAAALIAGRPLKPEEELFEAALRGDEKAIRKLLEAEVPARKIGERMPDRTVYAGISPDTNEPMFAAPADTGVYDHYSPELNGPRLFAGHGHKDFRVPTKNELSVLFNNRAAIGGFNVTGSKPAGWYWSSSRDNHGNAWAQRFSDGNQDLSNRLNNSSLRLVR